MLLLSCSLKLQIQSAVRQLVDLCLPLDQSKKTFSQFYLYQAYDRLGSLGRMDGPFAKNI